MAEKVSQAEAGYRLSESPFQRACEFCVFYSPGSCDRVAGAIRPHDLCDLYSGKYQQGYQH